MAEDWMSEARLPSAFREGSKLLGAGLSSDFRPSLRIMRIDLTAAESCAIL
jgi:hypothetical protein